MKKFPEIQICAICISENLEDGNSNMQRSAREVSDLIMEIDPLIQKSTTLVCPSCASVCCINRHSYHTTDDVLYIHALGKDVPLCDRVIDDNEPCRFLGEQGCIITRPLRPYRCTWYFCTPLLEHFNSWPAADYRSFISSFEKLTRKRRQMLDAFSSASLKSKSLQRFCRTGCIYDSVPYRI